MAGLNKSEFDSLVGLLARAHYHGDTAMLEQHVTKAYDGLVKESGVPVSDLPPVPGAMTDGSKRRLTADSVLDEFDNFEFVEDPEEILAHKLELEAIRDEIESSNTPVVPPMAIGQYGAATAAVNRGGIQGSVPSPKGVLSDEEWGLTLCELPAVASLEMSYEQLRDRARAGDTKLRGYLSWLCGTYGPAGIRQIQTYGSCRSQGFDCAAWLKGQCWDVCEAGRDHRSFERKFAGAKPKSRAAVPKAKSWSKSSA